jgi:glyoxylase-like metal-dependent hydrolase (beta-lactamase superfamily II)
MFSFRNSRELTDFDADGYERDGKGAPLSPGIGVEIARCHCMSGTIRDVPSANTAIRRLEWGRDKTAGTRGISEQVKPRMRPGVPPRSSWKMSILILSVVAMFAGSPLPAQNAGLDANELIRKAQAAIGGASVHSIQVIGVGTGSLFGQALEPDFVWPKLTYTRFIRAMDFENNSYREDVIRARGELLGGGATPPFGHGGLLTIGMLKDDLCWNTAGPFAGPAPGQFDARNNDLWTTSPQGVLIAAKRYGAVAANKVVDGQTFTTLSFAIPRTLTAVVWLNHAGFVVRIDSQVPDAVLGDTDIVTRFEDYRDVEGLKFPMHLRQSQAGTEVFDIAIQNVKVDLPLRIDVPAGIRGAKPPINVQNVGWGVWFLEGPTHNSVAIEMNDQIVLVESPISDSYAERMFLAANALVAGKKVGTVIATHHHFDHVGGLRYAAAEGAKLMVSSLALPFYEKVFANPNTIRPDQLARSGRKPVLVGVDEGTVLSDDTQKIEIHEVRNSAHSRGFLMVYVPRDWILIEADEFQIPPGGRGSALACRQRDQPGRKFESAQTPSRYDLAASLSRTHRKRASSPYREADTEVGCPQKKTGGTTARAAVDRSGITCGARLVPSRSSRIEATTVLSALRHERPFHNRSFRECHVARECEALGRKMRAELVWVARLRDNVAQTQASRQGTRALPASVRNRRKS